MAKILRVTGAEEELTDLSLESLQKVVGGYIEPVRTKYGLMWVNEEGLIQDLPLNELASEKASQPIRGDVVLLTAEEERKELEDSHVSEE